MWRESGWWYGGNALSALTHVKYVCQGLARPPESQSIIPTPSSLSLWMSISDQACGIVLRTTTKKNNTDKVLLNFTCPRCPSQENTVHQKFMCPLSSVNLVICLRLVVKEEERASQIYPDNCWYDTRRALHFWPWYAGSLLGQCAAAG